MISNFRPDFCFAVLRAADKNDYFFANNGKTRLKVRGARQTIWRFSVRE
jgi:hypothetical protein